jgi:rSAM/selenodomain-associated transferase 2
VNPLSSISVVIPALNEARRIREALDSVGHGDGLEVIVVDGGSEDETPALAERWGARVVAFPRGRALQMNAGARLAAGEALLFLHADSRLPADFRERVRETLASPGVAAGAFEVRFDASSLALRVVEWTANWRARHSQLPFGDQAIFVRADTFRGMGGFREIPIMEDVDLIRRLRKRGRILVVPSPVVTSPRRYEDTGVIWRTLLNKIAITGYYLGVSPERIARLYEGRRNRLS